MAEIELVIKIPEESYKAICYRQILRSDVENVVQGVRTGTPLPKGHGRLIDGDAFIATMEDASARHKYKELLIDDRLTVDDVFKAVIESLQNRGLAEGEAPTIIEANNGSEG